MLTNAAIGQQTKLFTISGRIFDLNARPIAGAEVAAYEKFYNYSSGQEYTRILGPIKKTDSSGHFVINADINSQYDVFIVARKKGLSLGWDVLPYSRSNEPQRNFNIILEPPCVLAGNVVDETGNPVVEAGVLVLPKTSYLSRLRQRPILAPQQWFITKTDVKGNFSFNNLAPDVSADFWIDAPGKASIYKYTTHSTSSCGFEAGRSDIHLVLPAEIKIQGRVIDKKTGKPVSGIGVLIQPDTIKEHKNPYCPQEYISGQDGQFSFKGIPAGKHLLKVLSPEKEIAKWVGRYVEVDIQPAQDVKDIIIEVDKGQIMEVMVREGTTKQPLHNIRVSAYSESSSGQGWTNTEGIARIRVPTGEYKVYSSAQQYSYYRSDKPVVVTKDQETELSILLDRKDCVSGIVFDESGRPVAGALVRAHPFGDEGLTGINGSFEVGCREREGEQILLARHIQRNLAATIRLKDMSQPQRITLKPALSVVGNINNINGEAIPAARLSLSINVPGSLSRFASETLTDTQGHYRINAVPPPEGFGYRLSVNALGYGPEDYKRISITGKPGTTVEMETIVLQPVDQSISGIVMNAEGRPAAGVPIFLHGLPGSTDQPEKSTATDNNGRFKINRICKGKLRLQANFSSSPGGSGFIQAEGGDENVKIILGQEGVHKPYFSLLSKSLPNLKDLKVDLSLDDLNEKMILVCFWDMQQRPSRNCIMRLAKQSVQLKPKGVTVIAVQASKIDENILNQWVKKYNIPFIIGMVEGDEEKTRFAWGVRSLPWLILTDSKHIVQAEGFSVNELKERIATLREK